MLWGITAYYVKLIGEDLLRYSNKTESDGLRKCLYYHYLTKNVMCVQRQGTTDYDKSGCCAKVQSARAGVRAF